MKKRTFLGLDKTAVMIMAAGVSMTGWLPAASGAEAPASNGSGLPLSEVILYSSGVGYFERAGDVTGKAQVDLRFKTEDVNDLLKSMVVQDAGGKVTAVTYGSRDPLTRTLQSFGLDLTANPTLGQLLNQARGEKVSLQWPNALTGTILGVETKKQPTGENKQVDVEYLNLLTEDGLQSIPLGQVQKIKLLNERLDSELTQALAMLAASHEKDKKTVGITFDGTGKRKVSVSYVTQTPVWKTSYRLVLEDKGNPFLQGWAIVENTSDEDWNDVKLSLVSGRPISFVMDLYEPLYTTRPVVEPELFRSLHPQVYEDALQRNAEVSFAATLAPAAAGLAQGRGGRGAAGGGGFGGGGRGGAAPLSRSLAESTLAQDMVAPMNAPMSLAKGVASMADTSDAGELFQYEIKTPVTIARQKSAMLPIVNQEAAGEKLSIYNESVHAKFPVNGFRLKNTTGLNLMQGPITVFDGGTYAGDARIEDLAPGQDRLLSYGLDLKAEVSVDNGTGANALTTVVVKKGTLTATRRLEETKTFSVKNKDQKKKTILVEQPVRAGWKLEEPKAATETTRDVYRFAVNVDADKLVKLAVKETRDVSETTLLANLPTPSIVMYMGASKASAKVKEALKKVSELRDQLDATAATLQQKQSRVNEISTDQGRIRENMRTLDRASNLYNRYVSQLTDQEKELETLQGAIEDLRTTQAKQQKALDDYMTNLDVE